MKREHLNTLRRCAGVPQDFSSTPEPQPETVTEDVVPGMSQVLRGGKHKFYLVVEASKDSDLGDVITEVDIRALANIVRGAGSSNTKDWELFPHNKQNDALNLARERLAKAGAEEVKEGMSGGVQSRSADSVPVPSDDEMAAKLELEEENFEPATNICPDCEGGEHPPAVGKCERCAGEGEIFESYSKVEIVGALNNFIQDQEYQATPITPRELKARDVVKFNQQVNDVEAEEEYGENEDYVEEKRLELYDAWVESLRGVQESVHYHTTDNYALSHGAGDNPKNVDTSSSGDTVWDAAEENEEDYEMTDDDQTIKVPSKILSELKRVIGEVTRESEKAKPRDFERANYYEDTAEALQIVYDELAKKTVQGLKQAQYLSHRMMNVQRALMPDSVWKFIVDGGERRSLKSYMSPVKEPVTGKPFGNVGIATLNKNTHTQ